MHVCLCQAETVFFGCFRPIMTLFDLHTIAAQSLYRQFVDFLRGVGVEAVPTVGTPFDPNLHEAIMKEPSSEFPDNTVLMEFRKVGGQRLPLLSSLHAPTSHPSYHMSTSHPPHSPLNS